MLRPLFSPVKYIVANFSAITAFPGQDCVLCGVESGNSVVCAACEPRLPRSAGPDSAVAAYAYRFPVDRLVQRFKFGGDLAVGHWLGLQLAGRVQDLSRPDILVAPPLWKAKLCQRGFNPALELARTLGRRLAVPVLWRGTARTRDTGAQTGLRREARQRNLEGAFRIDRDLSGHSVAIIDDVMTTGATAEALAQALRAAGAARIDVWVAARTPNPGPAS